MEIVELTEKYLKGFNDLASEVCLEEVITVNERKSLNERKKWFEGYQTQRKLGMKISLVGLEDGKVIGDASATRQQGKRDHVWEIGYQVRNNFRKSGNGSELVKTLIDNLNSKGAKQLIAWVNEANTPSIGILKKFGFKETGRIKLGVKLKEGKYCDYILFQKTLIK